MEIDKKTNQYTKTKEWKRYLALMSERPKYFVPSDILQIITEPSQVNEYVARTGKKLGVMYESPYHLLVVDLVRNTSDSLPFAYERLLPAAIGQAVVTIPIYNDKFVLLKQYRHAIRAEQYAFPRGFGESNLSGEENAKKELLEEIGAQVSSVRHIGNICTDSGIMADHVGIYECTLNHIEKHSNYEGIEEVILLSGSELNNFINERKITDSFTLSAWMLYKMNGVS